MPKSITQNPVGFAGFIFNGWSSDQEKHIKIDMENGFSVPTTFQTFF